MRSLFTALLIFTAASALAQPSWVTLPDGGRVPCDHPSAVAASLGCGVAPITPPVLPPPAEFDPSVCRTYGTVQVCTWAQCIGASPYSRSDWSNACTLYAQQFAGVTTRPIYRLGQAVAHPYAGVGLVIGLTRAIDGIEVVTIEVVETHAYATQAGDVRVCRNNGDCLWTAVQ